MQQFTKALPLSLYIHIPWCIQKCPYCDFNSHTARGELPEKQYLKTLIDDLEADLKFIQARSIESIFIGGGTPSLITPEGYNYLFEELHKRLNILSHAEITLEANPGTVEQSYFVGYRQVGINRISLGIQSLDNAKLKALGRIHDSEQAVKAVHTARSAGFNNINLDLMYGLPGQNIQDALSDLSAIIALKPDHLSWYHLTLEPNTLFYKHPPTLPEDELIWQMQEQGQALLHEHGFAQYEVSAYAQLGKQCQHNINYWQFGDYLGIGAGAHGKTTCHTKLEIIRSLKAKNPRDYINASPDKRRSLKTVNSSELPLEFVMNILRLREPTPFNLFQERTGLQLNEIERPLNKAVALDLLQIENQSIKTTAQGRLFLNELLELFM